jgi:hypothetical protein
LGSKTFGASEPVTLNFKMMKNMSIAAGIVFLAALPAIAADKPAANWVGTWAASPMACPVKSGEPSAGDSTYRNIMRVSIGGKGLRVQLTNEFGNSGLMVGAARIGFVE